MTHDFGFYNPEGIGFTETFMHQRVTGHTMTVRHMNISGSRSSDIRRFSMIVLVIVTLMIGTQISMLQFTPQASATTSQVSIGFFVTEIPDTVGGGFEPHIISGPGIDGSEWIYVDSPTGLGSGVSGNLWITKDQGMSWEFKPKDPFVNFGSSGDSYTAISGEGYIYYTDLYLATAAIQTSLDGGETWLQNPVASEYVLDDRQWLVIGPSASPTSFSDQTLYFAFNQIPGGLVMLRSEVTGTGMEWIPCNGGNAITYNGGYRDYFDVDQNDGTIYCPNGEGGSIMVYVSSNGGTTFTQEVVQDATPGQNIFISVAVDSAGNVYLTWSDQSDIWFASSRDQAQNWDVHKVTTTKGTRVLPWITAGDEGRVGLVWYGTDTEGDSNNADQMAEALWDIECALSVNALDEEPEFLITTIEEEVHGGTISTGGLGGNADRDVGDFFTCDVDEMGSLITAYGKDGDDGPNQRNSVIMFARQTDGPYLLADTGPIANFTSTTDGLKVKADAEESFPAPGGSIVEYQWDWGDGKMESLPDPVTTHEYSRDGRYTITLTVVDEQGLTSTVAAAVSVEENEQGFLEGIGGTAMVGGFLLLIVLISFIIVVLMRRSKPPGAEPSDEVSHQVVPAGSSADDHVKPPLSPPPSPPREAKPLTTASPEHPAHDDSPPADESPIDESWDVEWEA